jgi:hypothetical protein
MHKIAMLKIAMLKIESNIDLFGAWRASARNSSTPVASGPKRG